MSSQSRFLSIHPPVLMIGIILVSTGLILANWVYMERPATPGELATTSGCVIDALGRTQPGKVIRRSDLHAAERNCEAAGIRLSQDQALVNNAAIQGTGGQ